MFAFTRLCAQNAPMNPLATAADCADTLLVARRARNWIFGLLLFILLLQLALFFTARYSHALDRFKANNDTSATPQTLPSSIASLTPSATQPIPISPSIAPT